MQLNEAFKLMRIKKYEHRDLKPENILIKFVNEKDFVINSVLKLINLISIKSLHSLNIPKQLVNISLNKIIILCFPLFKLIFVLKSSFISST